MLISSISFHDRAGEREIEQKERERERWIHSDPEKRADKKKRCVDGAIGT